MPKPANVSPIHAVVALIVLASVTTFAVYFLEPKPKEDPFAKSEELRLLIQKLPLDVKGQVVRELGVPGDRYDGLPYDRLERLVTVLDGEAQRLATVTGEQRTKRVEKLLEQIDLRDDVPPELRGVGIVEKIGVKLPLDLPFRDHTGKTVTLGSYFKSGLPVILTLNYSDCPQLCHIQLDNAVDVMRENKIIPGQGFWMVTLSINPNEAPNRSMNARQNYLGALEAPYASWFFLTSPKEEPIKELARTVGFNYRYDPVKKDYAHSSALILCTPDGVVSNYYQGMEYKPDELRQRIADAAAGKQYAGSDVENYANCKVYDGTKPYALKAQRALKIVAVIFAILILLGLTILWMIPAKKPDVLPPLEGDKHV